MSTAHVLDDLKQTYQAVACRFAFAVEGNLVQMQYYYFVESQITYLESVYGASVHSITYTDL
jgi:hypothetical protein